MIVAPTERHTIELTAEEYISSMIGVVYFSRQLNLECSLFTSHSCYLILRATKSCPARARAIPVASIRRSKLSREVDARYELMQELVGSSIA